MGNFINKLGAYQVIPRELIFDNTLSDRARFVYCYMASKPNNWEFFMTPMAKEIGYSVDTLRKYINELIESGWLIKGEQKNDGLFGAVTYTLNSTKISDTKKNRYGEIPTQHNRDNRQNTDKKQKEEREESLSKKDELFEECWKAYRRKGSKSKSKSYWNKLKDDEKNRVLDHIKAYVSARDINYQQDFERYLRDKTFDSLVIKGNDILFDPTCATDTDYHPFGNYSILYDDISKQYIYIGYCDGRMSDSYTDDNRPDGATIILNSGRGTIVWSKAEQKWIHKKI